MRRKYRREGKHGKESDSFPMVDLDMVEWFECP